MTEKNEMPERLYQWNSPTSVGDLGSTSATRKHDDDVEYIRADLATPRAVVAELVSALEFARKCLDFREDPEPDDLDRKAIILIDRALAGFQEEHGIT